MPTARTRSPDETQALAARLGALCEPGDVIALSGDLGAGKTCFAQGLARGLGVPDEERVASPTFNIVLEHAGRIPLYHLDLYRLDDPGELDEIGLDHYLSGRGVCAVEWLDKFPGRAPPDRLEVAIAVVSDEERELRVGGIGPRGEALARAWLG